MTTTKDIMPPPPPSVWRTKTLWANVAAALTLVVGVLHSPEVVEQLGEVARTAEEGAGGWLLAAAVLKLGADVFARAGILKAHRAATAAGGPVARP